MRTFQGTRTSDEGCKVTVDDRLLQLRLDLRCHSPAGFEWSCGRSGPAQLALALLAEHTGDDQRALRLYQPFTRAVVLRLPYAGWTLTDDDIAEALDHLDRPHHS
jgi:hypothetical protein